MKNGRKRLIVSLAVLLGVCTIAVIADPTCVLLGLLRNESFYQGRPTAYWSREIERLQGTKSTSWLDTCQDWFLNLFRSNEPLTKDDLAVLNGRRDAVPVLKELLRDKTPFVRWTAAFELFYTKNAEPAELIPALCEALQYQDDYSTRSCAATMLECLAPDPETEMAVPALILALNDTPKFRIRVCVSGMAHNTLYRLGAPAVPALIEALKDPDIARRREVARVLGSIGLEARAAAPALHEALNDRSICADAALALWEMDAETDAVTDALLSALKDADPENRSKAASALGKMHIQAEKVIPALVESFRDETDAGRIAAAEALAELGSQARDAVPALGRALQDEDGSIRRAAARSLARIGPEARAAVPDLIRALKHEDCYFRSEAAWALRAVGPDARAAVPALIESLRDPHVGYNAADALAKIGPDAKVAVPALLNAMKDPDTEDRLRDSATFALGALSPEDPAVITALIRIKKDRRAWEDPVTIGPAAVPALIEALKVDDVWTRQQAASTLGEIGPRASAAVPTLIETLKDSDWSVGREATLALVKIDPKSPKVISGLIEALRRPKGLICCSAANALGNIGPDARAATAALREVLQTPGVSTSAAHALWKVAGESDPFLRLVLDTLKNGDPDSRAKAVSFLGEIGIESEVVILSLIDALKDKEDSVRSGAAKSLGKMAPAAKTAIPALIEALNDKQASVQGRAAAALGRFGPEAQAAMPALRAARRRIAITAKSDFYYGSAIGWVDSSAAWAWGEMTEAIWRIGGKAEEVVPDLIVLLKIMPVPAAKSLSLIGSEARAAVPALAGLLRNEGHFELQRAAAVALGSIGPDARAAVPALVKCLRQKEVAPVAAAALKKIDPEAAAKAGIR